MITWKARSLNTFNHFTFRGNPVMMKTKTKNGFNAVDYMRKVREELSNLYQTDRKRYFEEIKKAMADFKETRHKTYH